MTSPVFQALVKHRLQEANGADADFRAFVFEKLGNPPAPPPPPPEFEKWCDGKGVPSRPASPMCVAAFILEQQHAKPGPLLETVLAISESHASAGLADPTANWQVGEALSRLTKVEPPRSWPSSEKTMWLHLPEPLRNYLSIREANRDRVLRNKMNEIADAKKQLLKEITPHGPVEEQHVKNQSVENSAGAKDPGLA